MPVHRPAQTAHPINLTAGVNHINLVGRLLPYSDDPAALAQLSVLFSNYLNGLPTDTQARGRSVSQPNGDSITWLQQGTTLRHLERWHLLTRNFPARYPSPRAERSASKPDRKDLAHHGDYDRSALAGVRPQCSVRPDGQFVPGLCDIRLALRLQPRKFLQLRTTAER